MFIIIIFCQYNYLQAKYHVYTIIINAVSESKGHTHIELHKVWYYVRVLYVT